MDDEVINNVWPNSPKYRSYYNMKALGYIDLAFFAMIVISNALVIMVFTKKKKTSPMDVIFIHIAVIESLAAVAYVPRAIHELILSTLCSIPDYRTYQSEIMSLHSYWTAFLFRGVADWLAIMLAVWRYITVLHPLKTHTWCNMKITRIFITAGYIFSILISIPPYFSVSVGESVVLLDPGECYTSNTTIGKNTTIYEFQVTLENHPVWYTAVFLGYSVLQIVPSLVFAFISFRLIMTLYDMKKSNEEMCLNSHHYFRTTIILVVIFLLFAMAEIPHGIFALLTAFYGPTFFWDYYFYTMEICNSVIHISQSFNFIIYYSMSNQFRQTFKELFTRKTMANNEAVLEIMGSAQRYVSPSSGVDRSLGIGNQSSISRDIN